MDKAHPEAEEYISNALGHHVDIINEATKEGNKSIEEFKRGKAKEDLEKAKAEAEKIVSEAEDFAKEYEVVSAAYEAKKEVVDRLEAVIEENEEKPAKNPITRPSMVRKTASAAIASSGWRPSTILITMFPSPIKTSFIRIGKHFLK